MNLISQLGRGNMQIPALTAFFYHWEFIANLLLDIRSCFWNSWKRDLKV